MYSVTRQGRGRRRQGRGVTLIDALLATFFLMLAFSTILTTLVTGIRASRRSREYLTASLAARQVVENIRSFREAQVPVGTYNATSLGSVPQLASLTQATASVTISAWSGRANQAVVTVRWYSDAGTRTLTQKFTTLICSDGVAE